jgi:hypothetical protein
VQRQYQDLKGLSEALQAAQERKQDRAQNVLQMAQQKRSGGPPQARDYNEIEQPGMSSLEYTLSQFNPQSEYGMKLAQIPLKRQLERGRGRYERGEPYTNDKGQRVVPLYDKQTGKLVRTQPLGKTQQDQWETFRGKGGQILQKNKKTGKIRKAVEVSKGSAKEREIQRYLDLGIAETPQQAVKLAEGQYEIGQDWQGNSVIIDKTSGEVVKPLKGGPGKSSGEGTQTQQQGKTGQSQGEQDTYLSIKDIERSFGPISAMKRGINDLFGWAIPGQAFPEEERSANRVQAFAQRIRPFLQVSSRGAKWDVENINKVLPTPTVFKDPDAATDYVNNLTGLLEASIQSKEEILANKQLTKEQRKQFLSDINKLQTALRLMPDTEQFERGGGQQGGQELTIQDIQAMGREEIKQIPVDQLSPAQKQALEARVDEILGEE